MAGFETAPPSAEGQAGTAVATALPSLPAFWELRAPADWQAIDFISDLHLAANTPNAFAAFAAHLRHTEADAVFILGDLFEAWVGDDARFDGFERDCAEVLAEAASQRTVAFMAGNRDFLVGADLLKACGVMALADPTVLVAFGERVLLSHGDALCLGDVPYQRFRAMVRSPQWRVDFLSRPLAVRQRLAREVRHESERRHGQQPAGRLIDVDCAAAVQWMHETGTPTLIHGHTHLPGSEPLAPGFMRHVLSDWSLDAHEVGGSSRAEVLRWQRAGLYRQPPSTALAGADGTAMQRPIRARSEPTT